MISWVPPLNRGTTSAVAYYTVQYKTLGTWVEFRAKIVDKTWYLWTTASRGAVYSFRVYSYSPSDVASEPSAVVRFNTKGKDSTFI